MVLIVEMMRVKEIESERVGNPYQRTNIFIHKRTHCHIATQKPVRTFARIVCSS